MLVDPPLVLDTSEPLEEVMQQYLLAHSPVRNIPWYCAMNISQYCARFL